VGENVGRAAEANLKARKEGAGWIEILGVTNSAAISDGVGIGRGPQWRPFFSSTLLWDNLRQP
jgi:hypothetical protein